MTVRLSKEDAMRSILDVVRYCPDSVSGLVWTVNVNSRARADGPALAAKDGRGYCNGSYRYQNLKAHRVVWFLHHGTLPDCIDHIDGNRSNNHIENLRAVTRQENSQNCVGKGYTFSNGKYTAQIGVNGTVLCLGRFSTEAKARAAYLRAKRMYHAMSAARLRKG